MGKRVFDDGCGIPEKTLVTVGDDANLNAGALIQCHSMEDGAFKLDGITIGSKVTIGVSGFVHYGVTMNDGAELGFYSSGHEIPEGGTFGGNPAQDMSAYRVRDAQEVERQSSM